MRKLVFIISHFGKFNNYFEFWLHSCSYNSTIDWLLFTDDRTTYKFPQNVKVHYTTFDETVKLFQKNFDFDIILETPYQLCEFKVSYGEVFADYIKDYDFWGHCDTDLIWGNLRRHLPDEVLDNYTKISWRGHLTLYRNNEQVNRLYRMPIEGAEFYRYAMSNDTAYPLAPDERAVNYIFEKAGEKIYQNLVFADLKIRSYNFELLHFPTSEDYKNKHQVFLWEEGNLFRLFVHGNEIFREDFAYIHFLKRPMKLDREFILSESMVIIPNKFIGRKKPITVDMIKAYSRSKLYWSYLLQRISPKYFKSKRTYLRSKKLFKQKYSFVPLKAPSYRLPAIKETAVFNNLS